MKSIVLFSSGIDSSVALYQCRKMNGAENILALTFDYQSKHNKQEIKMAKKVCYDLGVKHLVIDLREVSKYLKSNLLKSGGRIPNGHYSDLKMKKTVVPFRNGIMLAIACGIAESFGAQEIIISSHQGDHAIYPDCRDNFMSAMGEATRLGTYVGVRVISPFKDQTKTDLIRLGTELSVGWERSYSCYNGQNVHCGTCSTCFERREAFADSGTPDPTKYQNKTNFYALKEVYTKNIKSRN